MFRNWQHLYVQTKTSKHFFTILNIMCCFMQKKNFVSFSLFFDIFFLLIFSMIFPLANSSNNKKSSSCIIIHFGGVESMKFYVYMFGCVHGRMNECVCVLSAFTQNTYRCGSCYNKTMEQICSVYLIYRITNSATFCIEIFV